MCCGQKRAVLKSASPPTPSMVQGVRNPRASSTVHQATITRTGSYYTSPPATQDVYNPMTGRVQQAPQWAGSPCDSVTLRYLESSPILVLGPATGRQYEFSGAHPFQSVDARDAEPLLRTLFFRRNS